LKVAMALRIARREVVSLFTVQTKTEAVGYCKKYFEKKIGAGG